MHFLEKIQVDYLKKQIRHKKRLEKEFVSKFIENYWLQIKRKKKWKKMKWEIKTTTSFIYV